MAYATAITIMIHDWVLLFAIWAIDSISDHYLYCIIICHVYANPLFHVPCFVFHVPCSNAFEFLLSAFYFHMEKSLVRLYFFVFNSRWTQMQCDQRRMLQWNTKKGNKNMCRPNRISISQSVWPKDTITSLILCSLSNDFFDVRKKEIQLFCKS